MGIRKLKPTTPSLRWQTYSDFADITKGEPEKSLLRPLRKHAGRNAHGHVTSRHKGGGNKRSYRIIDFKRDRLNEPAKVIAIEYDPNRSSRIALIEYSDGKKSYIVAPLELKVNDIVMSGPDADLKPGNALPLRNIAPGIVIHNIELIKGSGGQIVRSAGAQATILAKDGAHAHVKLPSSEVRLINLDCYATIGQISNVDHNAVSIGKAGRSRHMGIRPHVRGVAMNPHDHPLGGGEGKSSGGRHPCTPWGKPTKGYKTRRHNKRSNKFIVKRRNA